MTGQRNDDLDSPVRVGDISRATGLTVRTLHYYEEIGLVTPDRTAAGHRLYDAAAVDRLYRVQLMRTLGMSLADISRTLDSDTWDPARLTRRRIADLDEHLAGGHRLRDRLSTTLTELDTDQPPETSSLLTALKELTMYETAVRRRIPTLVYSDVAAAQEYLVRVFGFEPGQVDRDQDGTVGHAEVTAGDGVIWLHRVAPEFGLDTPLRLGAETAGISVIVDDVDAHHARAVEQGAAIRYQPVDQSYGYREYAAVDLDGRLWAFMTPID